MMTEPAALYKDKHSHFVFHSLLQRRRRSIGFHSAILMPHVPKRIQLLCCGSLGTPHWVIRMRLYLSSVQHLFEINSLFGLGAISSLCYDSVYMMTREDHGLRLDTRFQSKLDAVNDNIGTTVAGQALARAGLPGGHYLDRRPARRLLGQDGTRLGGATGDSEPG